MQHGLISIVIPVYNHKEAFTKALVSIKEQTYRPVEIIVIDSGSSEPLPESNEYLLIRKENTGAPSARNAGLKRVGGEYVIFWDADITAIPDFLEKLYTALQNNPSASFAYSNMSFGLHKMPAQKFNKELLKQKNYIHSTSLIRKKDAIFWDETLKRFQDWDLWLSMAEQGKTGVWVDEFLFVAEQSGKGISHWLPSFAYQKPWKCLPWFSKKVCAYESARSTIAQKHNL